jgi:allantoinase
VDNELFDYSPIVNRPPIHWPNGARVAFYVGLNIEYFEVDKPSTSINSFSATFIPDPMNYGWRDYGVRVGVWRTIEALDRHGIRASVLLNSEAAHHYPQIIEAGKARDWAWLAHGKNNSMFQVGMEPAQELAFLTEMTDSIEQSTGQRPTGWLGPGLTETFNTPRLLRQLGYEYVLDWTNDDQPYALNVPGMYSVPYSVEVNDFSLFLGQFRTGDEFVQVLRDQFDQLDADAEADSSGRVMGLPLHPFVTGQSFRAKYLDRALEYIVSRPNVWVTTSDEIARHYIASQAGS